MTWQEHSDKLTEAQRWEVLARYRQRRRDNAGQRQAMRQVCDILAVQMVDALLAGKVAQATVLAHQYAFAMLQTQRLLLRGVGLGA